MSSTAFAKSPFSRAHFSRSAIVTNSESCHLKQPHAHSVSVKHIVALYKAIIAPPTRRASGVRMRVQKAEFQAPKVAKMSTVNVVPKAVPKRPHTSQNTVVFLHETTKNGVE